VTLELAELKQAKLNAEVLYDMFRTMYTNAQLRAMSDAEFEQWKAELYRLWSAVCDAERAIWQAQDQVTA